MASIEKRSDNSYRIVVSAGYDSKGKKIRKSKTITLPETMTERQKEKEVQKQAALFEREVENGTFLDGEKITFAEFAEKWLVDYAEKNLSPGTLKPYKTRLEKRIIPAIGHIKLSKLQPHHLMEFYNNLSENGMRMDCKYTPTKEVIQNLTSANHSELGISLKTFIRIKEGKDTTKDIAAKIAAFYGMEEYKAFQNSTKTERLSDKTIKHHHDLISTVLGAAVKWNLLTSNPAERVGTLKTTKTKSGYYDDEQLNKMFIALENEPLKYKTIIYLAIDTGLRLSEIAGLEWSDIDFKENTLTVDKQRQYVSGYGIINKSPKTENGNRVVTISDTVIKMLKKYQVSQKENKMQFANMWVDSNYIFTHEDGKPLFPSRPYKWFTEFLERHNLPKITFHQLRHTNASLLISAGTDIVTLSGRLGHADKNVTLNTYSHIIKSSEKKAANKMDSFYAKISEK